MQREDLYACTTCGTIQEYRIWCGRCGATDLVPIEQRTEDRDKNGRPTITFWPTRGRRQDTGDVAPHVWRRSTGE